MQKISRRKALFSAAAGIAAPFIITRYGWAQTGSIKFGMVEPLSGPNKYYGESRVDAVRLVVERINASGGLLGRKVEYLRDLASHFASGRLDPKAWRKMDDEALIAALVEVKGIGRWTAEMFLMFHELRADVLPVGDIGLQNAIALHYHDGERPTVEAMRDLALAWRPYRSVATWYLWRSLDPVPVEY